MIIDAMKMFWAAHKGADGQGIMPSKLSLTPDAWHYMRQFVAGELGEQTALDFEQGKQTLLGLKLCTTGSDFTLSL
jgi:hypothetical protein